MIVLNIINLITTGTLIILYLKNRKEYRADQKQKLEEILTCRARITELEQTRARIVVKDQEAELQTVDGKKLLEIKIDKK